MKKLNQETSKNLRILSIDGGGIKGVIPARILQEIEERTKKPIYQLFDYACGTSTGGLIISMLTCADENGKAKFTAQEVLEFYQKYGSSIFKKSIIRKFLTGFSLWGAKYSRRNLDHLLKKYLGNQLLSKTLIPVFIPTFYLNDQSPRALNTIKALENPEYDFYMHDVAGSTSAAPTFFNPKKFSNLTNSHDIYAIDGGIFSNDPEIIVITHLFKNQKFVYNANILSLGTGSNFSHAYIKSTNGIYGWLVKRQLISTMISADEDFDQSLISEILKCERLRLQTPLGLANFEIDDCNNISKMLDLTEKYIKEKSRDIDNFCEKLIL